MRAKHRGPRQAELHQLQAHHPIVDVPKLDARKFDHVDLDTVDRQIVDQRLDQALRIVMQEERAVQEVHAHDPERLLLQLIFRVAHAHVNDDLAILIARMGLKLHTDPAVAVVRAGEVARRDGVREREEGRRVAAGVAQSLQIELVLVVEHALQALARDVALGVPVDRVADGHVVGRDALGDRPGSAAYAEEPANDLLARTNLGEGAVAPRVQVDRERLAMRIEKAVSNERGT